MSHISLATHAMATRFEIVLSGDDLVHLRAAGEEALHEIERLHDQLSPFEPSSDISAINDHAAEYPVKVEPRLLRLLKRCADLTERTDGAFDATVGPLMRVWGFHGGEGRVPGPEDLRAALDVTGMSHVILDEKEFMVSFDRPGVRLDLGAIGKGYAIEKAVEILREAGVTSAIIHGGTSTVYAVGTQPDGSPWRIGVRAPERTSNVQCPTSNIQHPETPLTVFDLADSALSVSTTRGRYFAQDGREFGHELDPRTGEPVQGASSAVVVGPCPTECDALSTALLILGRPGLTLLEERFPAYLGVIGG